MFHLLQPFWLISLLGLAVPVAVHLWNRKRGRRIRVGSIALLKEAQSRRMSSIRLTEAGLLLLRCLLLALLGVALAGPQWTTAQKDAPKAWVLVSPELRESLRDSASVVRRAVDSLATPGRELRWFTPGFPAFSPQESRTQTNGPGANSAGDYWSLLREVDERLPGDASVYLLTGERLRAVRGERPAVGFDLKWLSFPTADSARRWVQEVFTDRSDSLRVVWGESRPGGNWLRTATLPIVPGTYRGTGGIAWRVSRENGLPAVQLEGGPVVRADTAATRIALYHSPAYGPDARYVRAATEAIARFTGRKIKLQTVTQADQPDADADWVFWLSHEPVPPGWAGRQTTFFRYPRSDSARDVDTWLEWPLVTARPLRVYRQFAAASPGTAMWRDGYGRPVLTAERNKNGTVYHFSGRFDPQWNDLVWHEAFPEALLALLEGQAFGRKHKENDAADVRLVDARQLLPRPADRKASPQVEDKAVPLREPLLLAAVLLFGLERWLSHRQKTQTAKKVIA